ncbi:hypothetical protein BDM02DRAFT_3108502 [Thelephora ganbajun]|uniref:Uncharacterized protein n=1 Tax=Thelephora ganbajun TaxID=370292 RepID=A0ACB6ZTD5_THEGA|nr:hypothetical protein BDM02DRAFT_3108502 [Thelephora ganbajun]
MSTVQEAASLFGSGLDEGLDPFGSVVNSSPNSVQDSSPFSPSPPTSSKNTTHDLNSSSVQGKVVTSNAHDYKAVDDLFGGAPSNGADDLFGVGGVSDSDWLATRDVNTDASADTQGGGYSGYSNYTNVGSLGTTSQSQDLSGYEQVQQQQLYQAYSNTYQNSYDSQNQYATASSYQPPAQSSTYSAQSYNYGPTSQHSAYTSPQQKTTHLKSVTRNPVSDAYDPYKPNLATTQSSFYSPSIQSTYDPYKPSVTSKPPTQATYDPYRPPVQQTPPVQASSQSRSTPAYGVLSSYSNAYSKPPVPAPPKVTAESFRTNTSNAYDPPMLPTRTRRHASGWGPTMTSPTHTSSFPPSSPVVSNTPLPPPRKDSAPVGPPPRSPAHAHQNTLKSPGLPPPPSRPSSREVLRETGVPHLPPPPHPSSRQVLPELPTQSPQQDSYPRQRIDSPSLGAQRNWIASSEPTTMSPEQSIVKTIPQPEQPLAGQNPEVSFDDLGDPEASVIAADTYPPIANANTSPGLSWDHEGGPSPSTARQADYVTPKDNEVGDATITSMPIPEQGPTASSHSRTSSYDRPYANDKLASPSKQTAPPRDSYKLTGSTVHHPPPASQFVPAPTQATSISYGPYKPTVPSTSDSIPIPIPSSPPVNGHSSRPGSLRSSLESTRPHISQYDYTPPVRSSSPASIRSQPGTYISSALKSEYGSSYDPYAPSNRTRSATNGTVSSVTSDTYTPRRQSNETQDHTPYGSKFGYPDRPSSRTESLLATPAYPTYAPSPSLLGTNDPLGRASARIPVISFGFGGKVVTCFHGADMSSAGFDVALSSRQSREIHVRSLHKLIPQSALEDTTVVYPGPLFGDSGSPTVSLVRGASTQTKTKKAKVVKYLEDRISELSSVVVYTSTGLLEHGRSQSKLTLFSLLKVLVENDGKLSGTPEIDKAVRRVLLPRLADDASSDLAKFTTPADGFGALGSLASNEAPISVTTLKPSALEKIQEFLIRGERRQACHYALDEKLWAHAMVIASSIDRDAWQEVVKEFIRAELGSKDVEDGKNRSNDPRRGSLLAPISNGRESLRVAYSLFAGQGATSVQSMLPPASLSRAVDNRLAPPPPVSLGVTPMSPNFPGNVATNVPVEVLASWAETVAMMVFNSVSPETSAALTALGDHLSANQWVEAAHACYLLSPQTSQFCGLGSPTTRLVLVGSTSPAVTPSFSKNPDSMILSEIVEFAYSLSTPQKGQEPFPGFPHLQPYRLIRAHQLAELGNVQLATRYCDAVTASVNRPSIYFTTTFIESLRGLSTRLIAAPSLDKSGSWISGSLSKPSLDKVGGWLGGQFTKFIAGEGDSSPAEEQKPGLAQGPFSHYSSISTTDLQSSYTSPHVASLNHHPSVAPPRTGSAMALRTMNGSPHIPINRSTSAMDHIRPHSRQSPVQRLASAGVFTTNFSAPPTSTYGTNGVNGYGHYQQTSSGLTSGENSPSTANGENDGPSGRNPWWDSVKTSDTQTPTAAAFQQQGSEDTGNFVSLVDDIPMPSIPSHRSTPQTVREEDEDEDLGFGNNANKKQTPSGDGDANKANGSATMEKRESRPPPKIEATKSEGNKPASSGFWLGRWWRKENAGPVRANLGEETSFYYDKELKRWVNKKAGADAQKPSQPPPPPRAQTTSPGKLDKPSPSLGNHPPPPPRPASAVDLSSPPRKTLPRGKSSLVPDNTQPVPQTPVSNETGFLQPPIPPSRPRSQASKKNVRSRYVDVFQQPTSTSPAPLL